MDRMDRTERFYKIEMLIRSRGSVPFTDLMEELGVSRATLKRDLEYLRERLDAPIVYDRFANGYSMRPDARDARQVLLHRNTGLAHAVGNARAVVRAVRRLHEAVREAGGVR